VKGLATVPIFFSERYLYRAELPNRAFPYDTKPKIWDNVAEAILGGHLVIWP